MEIIRNKFICIAGTKNNTNQEPLKKLTGNGEAMVGQTRVQRVLPQTTSQSGLQNSRPRHIEGHGGNALWASSR